MDSQYIKSLSEQELHDLLSDESWPTPPFQHQAATIVWAGLRPTPRIALWHDMGTGKTLASVYIHRWWRFQRMLVVCPNSVVHQWPKEIQNLTDYRVEALAGPAKKWRELALRSKARIHVINYEGLRSLFCRRVKRGNRQKYVPDRGLIREANYDALTFDECQHLSNPEALQTKIARLLSEEARQAIIMSGTPASNGLQDLHSQYLVLDGGRTLGRSYAQYIYDYFKKKLFGPVIKGRAAERAILDRVAVSTLRYDKSECLDLPDITETIRYCPLSKAQRNASIKLLNGIHLEFPEGELDVGEDAGQIANKLAQIAGGMVLLPESNSHRFPNTPKLDLLVEVIREAGPSQKIVVYHAYNEEARMIEERLESEGIKFAGQRAEVKGAGRFQEDSDCQVLVAHPRSGGVGLNLQCASCVIFYGPGMMGAALREQAVARVHRQGQTKPVTIVTLLTEGSIDEARLDKCRGKQEILRRATDYIAKHRGAGV
jgi:SNF2 family DNA or RNA helicase